MPARILFVFTSVNKTLTGAPTVRYILAAPACAHL
jgi:hypothetical protein